MNSGSVRLVVMGNSYADQAMFASSKSKKGWPNAVGDGSRGDSSAGDIRGGSISGKLPVASVNGAWVVVAGDSDCGEIDVCAGVTCGAMCGATGAGPDAEGALEDAESAVLALSRVVCALPALRDKTYWHFLPRLAQRAHVGFSLLHFSFEAAQWWQLSRSLRGV